jgi:DNA-binding transcriptional LysR family regulator
MEAALGLVLAFVRVVELQSFGKAAKALKLTPSAVSRQIKVLEESLGVRLLHRTTRAMSLTEAGEAYFIECQAGLEQIRLAQERAQQALGKPRGTLRISAPISFGRRHVVAHIAAFLASYPELQIELELTDRFADVVADGLSMALRIGRMPDSTLLSRKLLGNRRILVAAPGYATRLGPNAAPDDLAHLDCLALTINRDGEVWRLVGPDGERSIRPRGRVRADNGDAIATLAADGAGIAFLSYVNVAELLQARQLVQVLPRWTGRESGVFAVFPPARPVNPAVERLVGHLLACWSHEASPLRGLVSVPGTAGLPMGQP